MTAKLLHVQLVRRVRERRVRQVHSSRSEKVHYTCQKPILFGHRDGAVTVVLELVDRVIHNLCTRDVRENGTPCGVQGLVKQPKRKRCSSTSTFQFSNPKSSGDHNATVKTLVARRLHHRRNQTGKRHTHDCPEHGTRCDVDRIHSSCHYPKNIKESRTRLCRIHPARKNPEFQARQRRNRGHVYSCREYLPDTSCNMYPECESHKGDCRIQPGT